MNNKKICFVINSLKFGGIQSALISLLERIENQYDISLLSLNGYENSDYVIPKKIRLIETTKRLKIYTTPQKRVFKEFGFFAFFIRLVFAVWSKLFGSKLAKMYYCSGLRVDGSFDTTIAWSHNLPYNSMGSATTYICQRIVKANKSISYIHTDYVRSGSCDNGNNKEYAKSTLVAFMSESLRKQAKERTKLTNTCVSQCLVNEERVLKLKDESVGFDDSVFINKIVFVTVARLSSEKGICDGLKTFSLFKKSYPTIDFLWIVVGDGPLKSQIDNLIDQMDLRNNVILCGYDSNPFKYIEKAHFYISFSKYEGVPITFLEAKCQNKRIISTPLSSANDILSSEDLIIDGNYDRQSELISKFIFEHKNKILNEYGKKEVDEWNKKSILQFESLVNEYDESN